MRCVASPYLTGSTLAGFIAGAVAMPALTFWTAPYVWALVASLVALEAMPPWARLAATCSTALPPLLVIGLVYLYCQGRWSRFSSALVAGAAVLVLPVLALLAASPPQ